eukprot:4645266-Pyramimonas_sp.AAC.1
MLQELTDVCTQPLHLSSDLSGSRRGSGRPVMNGPDDLDEGRAPVPFTGAFGALLGVQGCTGARQGDYWEEGNSTYPALLAWHSPALLLLERERGKRGRRAKKAGHA